MQSTNLEYGRDYAFKIVTRGRIPGRHHIHPLLNVESVGPLVGPGKRIQVTGVASDFVYPLRTLDGIPIPNLETWQIGNVARNHAFWALVALVWLGWWLRRRPLLFPRYRAVAADRAESLVTVGDRAVAATLLVFTLASIAYGTISTNLRYPQTSALQGGRVRVHPLPPAPESVEVIAKRGVYHVPGRTLILTLGVTNGTAHPVRLGEFTAANLRFVNRAVPAVAVDPSYPPELVPPSGLTIDDDRAIQPTETRTIRIEASDAAWETERLASLMGNPDSSYGGLLFFFDDRGNRTIAEVSGPAIPVFMGL
jgi:methane/ammonia monooxygenase subunit B